jgi:glycosyltransferase involved in cell wall biosynthesis
MNPSETDRVNRHRPRILVESYECSPVRSHAPGAAWQILSRLSQWFDLWIITEQTQYQREIENYLLSHPDEGRFMQFHYIARDTAKGFGRQRPALPFREILDYRNWLDKSYTLAAKLDSQLDFDLVHHLRSNTFREPGCLWKLGKPAIWGPVGGSYCVPNCLLSFLNPAARLRYWIRNKLNQFQFAHSPKVKEAFAAASVILAQTSSDVQRIRQVHHRQAILCHEQGIGQCDTQSRTWDGHRPLRLVWAARCIAGKALPILLKAIHNLDEIWRVELHVIGDGAELKRWKRQAARFKINNQCIWHGWKTPQETQALMNQADVAVFSSILEGTPATIMESLAMGLPAIALKHCGFEDVISPDCGILIPCHNKKQIVTDFRNAIAGLLADPDRLKQMSKAAIQRGQRYTWDCTVRHIRTIYNRTLHNTCMLDDMDLTGAQHETTDRIEAECLTAAQQ